jgi:hypothetical protein
MSEIREGCSVRIKNVLVRATVTGVLIATAGLGAAITATPANALPRQCTSAQIEQLQQDSEFWGDEAIAWARWGDLDAADHDTAAVILDDHNSVVALQQATAADRELVACL